MVARRGEALRAIASSLPGTADTFVADVRDFEAMKEAARGFITAHGVPDIVIANAGISRGTLTECAEDMPAFRRILETNVLGLVNTFHPFLEPMRERGRGTLVGIASVAGFRGLPGSAAYSASKAAAIRYLEALRIESRNSGVRVVTICPGYIATPMTARNPFRMPFLIGADEAARRFARVIDRGKHYAIVPWPMAIAGRVLTLLPDVLYDRLAGNAGRKPRIDNFGPDDA